MEQGDSSSVLAGASPPAPEPPGTLTVPSDASASEAGWSDVHSEATNSTLSEQLARIEGNSRRLSGTLSLICSDEAWGDLRQEMLLRTLGSVGGGSSSAGSVDSEGSSSPRPVRRERRSSGSSPMRPMSVQPQVRLRSMSDPEVRDAIERANVADQCRRWAKRRSCPENRSMLLCLHGKLHDLEAKAARLARKAAKHAAQRDDEALSPTSRMQSEEKRKQYQAKYERALRICALLSERLRTSSMAQDVAEEEELVDAHTLWNEGEGGSVWPSGEADSPHAHGVCWDGGGGGDNGGGLLHMERRRPSSTGLQASPLCHQMQLATDDAMGDAADDAMGDAMGDTMGDPTGGAIGGGAVGVPPGGREYVPLFNVR